MADNFNKHNLYKNAVIATLKAKNAEKEIEKYDNDDTEQLKTAVRNESNMDLKKDLQNAIKEIDKMLNKGPELQFKEQLYAGKEKEDDVNERALQRVSVSGIRELSQFISAASVIVDNLVKNHALDNIPKQNFTIKPIKNTSIARSTYYFQKGWLSRCTQLDVTAEVSYGSKGENHLATQYHNASGPDKVMLADTIIYNALCDKSLRDKLYEGQLEQTDVMVESVEDPIIENQLKILNKQAREYKDNVNTAGKDQKQILYISDENDRKYVLEQAEKLNENAFNELMKTVVTKNNPLIQSDINVIDETVRQYNDILNGSATIESTSNDATPNASDHVSSGDYDGSQFEKNTLNLMERLDSNTEQNKTRLKPTISTQTTVIERRSFEDINIDLSGSVRSSLAAAGSGESSTTPRPTSESELDSHSPKPPESK